MTMLIVAFRNFVEALNNFLPLETNCLLPSSVGDHFTGAVSTFLAVTRNVSVSKRFFIRGLLHRHESNITISVGCESTFYWNSIT